MRAAGFNFSKGEIRYSLIEKSGGAFSLISKQRIPISATISNTALVSWNEKNFLSLLNPLPNKVAYRFNWNSGAKESARWAIFPCPILVQVCGRSALEPDEWVTANFAPTKFGFPKKTKPETMCNQMLGIHKPYWDQKQAFASLCAIRSLLV